jgi:hypothetical protein
MDQSQGERDRIGRRHEDWRGGRWLLIMLVASAVVSITALRAIMERLIGW